MLVNKIMKFARKSIVINTLSALALGIFSQVSLAQNRLIGYIPSYSNMIAVADRTDLSKLTHINLAFINPTANGAISNDVGPMCMAAPSGANVFKGDIAYVVNKAHAAGVKVLVSMAGGGLPACAGDWKILLRDSRTGLVNNIVSFVNSSNLDGVDIDIEGELLTAIDNAGNYTPFIQALRNALPGKLVTAATASYSGGMIPTSSIQYFDFVNIMSYDAIGPSWGVAGSEHSSYAQAQTDINTWLNRGLPKSKLVLGVPFYGYGFAGMPSSITFNDIVGQYGAAVAQNDVIGNRCAGCAYITYNGIPTIRNKTTLATQQGSGVMIWELSQDASGANSLLSTIRTQMGGTTPPQGGPAGYTRCASENQTCSFSGSASIAYGANGAFNYRTATNSIVCNNATFGDPISGVAKSCYYQITASGSTIVTIEAENFSNQSGVQTEACSEGGSNVGYIDTADWVSYTNVNIPASGTYRIDYRIASIGGGTLASNLNTNQITFPAVAVAATGGWQNWQTISQTVTINAGTYTFGIYASTGGWNINWIKFTKL